MIPTEDVMEGWYVARLSAANEWKPRRVYRSSYSNQLMVELGPFTASPIYMYQFHSRIPMPDATPEETPDERKSNDGE